MLKIAGGSATPEMVQAALESLGAKLAMPEVAPAAAETTENAPPPSLREQPRRTPCRTQRSADRKQAR